MAVNGIEITDVIIFPIRENIVGHGNTIKAVVKVVLNDSLILNGIKIYKGEFGHFISYPEIKPPVKLLYATTAEIRAYISDSILKQYELVTLTETTKQEAKNEQSSTTNI